MLNNIVRVTLNKNALVDIVNNAPFSLRVLDSFNRFFYVLIKKEHWLECHDNKLNTHKYYEIIETVGGSVVAFWGRIFKNGLQLPKFGEIKKISYTELLKSKIDKKDYQVMSWFESSVTPPDDYKEQVFKLIGVSGAKAWTKSYAAWKPQGNPSTLQSVPSLSSFQPIILPAPVTTAVIPENVDVKTKATLSTNQEIILLKLKQLEAYAINTGLDLAKFGIESIFTSIGMTKIASHIWDSQISIFWNDTVHQIKRDIVYIIEKLEYEGIIKKEDLITCNEYHAKLTEAGNLYKKVLQEKEIGR
jgi:predicted DNA-binding WGR domain protein